MIHTEARIPVSEIKIGDRLEFYGQGFTVIGITHKAVWLKKDRATRWASKIMIQYWTHRDEDGNPWPPEIHMYSAMRTKTAFSELSKPFGVDAKGNLKS